ncbi:MAG: hypothetical protein ACMUIS_10680 [bacterium]
MNGTGMKGTRGIASILLVGFILLLTGTAAGQINPSTLYVWRVLWPQTPPSIPAPILLIYLESFPCGHASSLYFNSIDGPLLGYGTSSPFLSPDRALLYTLLKIPTYQFPGSRDHTTFPYTPRPASIPYGRFDYPTYQYGSPGCYFHWMFVQ